jgi:hypothetical protein
MKTVYKFGSPTANECHDPLIRIPTYRLVSRHCGEKKKKKERENRT